MLNTLFYVKGYFEDRIMKNSNSVNVMKYGCDEQTGLLVVKKFSDPVSDQAFFYDPPTNSSFGGGAPQKVIIVKETYLTDMTQ